MSVDTNSILYKVGQAISLHGKDDSYAENTFTNGVLTGQSKYTSNGGDLLETKTFTYTSGNLTQVLVKDGSNVTTLTQTIAYDGDGNVSSITKDYE